MHERDPSYSPPRFKEALAWPVQSRPGRGKNATFGPAYAFSVSSCRPVI